MKGTEGRKKRECLVGGAPYSKKKLLAGGGGSNSRVFKMQDVEE